MLSNLTKVVIFLICLGGEVWSAMEGFIVGGSKASIKDYPHAAFLDIKYSIDDKNGSWVCGSSIINQYFLLTAAHCVSVCEQYCQMGVIVGHKVLKKGQRLPGLLFKAHEDYNEDTMNADIALVLLGQPLNLTRHTKRIILMKHVPEPKTVFVAGWGITDEEYETMPKSLKHAEQRLWSYKDCIKELGTMCRRCLCAGTNSTNLGYAAPGDSGSALVVNSYYQIGIVSYKQPDSDPSVVVYTDVRKYIGWIKNTTESMFCPYNESDDVLRSNESSDGAETPT